MFIVILIKHCAMSGGFVVRRQLFMTLCLYRLTIFTIVFVRSAHTNGVGESSPDHE